jgi:hypothetical protein
MATNPFEQAPVYEEDQVITIDNLIAIYNGYVYQYKQLPRWNMKRRWMLRVGMGIIQEILRWLEEGKPQGVIR